MTPSTCNSNIDLIAYRGNSQFDIMALSEEIHNSCGISDHLPLSAILKWNNKYHSGYIASNFSGAWTKSANRSAIGSYEKFVVTF